MTERTLPGGSRYVGVVAPYDFALDRELWRWTPEGVDLLLTRTPYETLEVSVAQAERIGDPGIVAASVRAVTTPDPSVVAYACTAGSFVGGPSGERALVTAMHEAGAPAAVTTSGAVVQALTALGVSRVAVATPYDEEVTGRLVDFLHASGLTVTGTRALHLTSSIWTVSYEDILELVRQARTPDCEAVFISCTNLVTYDVIADLEAELGVPVVTANQATMWAAVAMTGLAATGPGQELMNRGLP